MSTAATGIDQIEQLRSTAEETSNAIGRSRTRLAQIAQRIDSIGDDVRHGDIQRTTEIPALVEEQEQLRTTITMQETELAEIQAKLERQKRDTDAVELKRILDRMEARREHIVELVRKAALALGELHAVDATAAQRLVPLDRASTDRLRFLELIAPIDALGGKWADSKRDIPLGFEFVIKVRPVTPL
jgi:ABC-type transporter Mla subunit MlaD